MKLVLASVSPRRRELLERLGVDFEVVAPIGVDEESIHGPARWLAPELARLKAESVVRHLIETRDPTARDRRVLGADTVVALSVDSREEQLAKPGDAGDARRMISLLAGRTHTVWTGVALARAGETTRTEVERTEVEFRPLSGAEIDAYVATGDYAGKAGAYGIQGAGATLVRRIRGCFYNVVGLPVALAGRMLADVGAVAYACDCRSHPLQTPRDGSTSSTGGAGRNTAPELQRCAALGL